MRKELYELALMMAVVCLAIVGITVMVVSLLYREAPKSELPEPDALPRDEAVLLMARAPELEREGLVEQVGFETALEATQADLPEDVIELAGRAVWGEAGGIPDEAQRAAVVWCACNRADAWDMDIGDVLNVEAFHGLAITGDVPEEHLEVARDALARWALEHDGWVDVGRVLPSQYLFFEGDGQHNYFSTEYGGGEYWQGW